MIKFLKQFWCYLRHASGDDAYEQYLKHYSEFHAATFNAPPPLDRQAFFKLWQDRKWSGINRCC